MVNVTEPEQVDGEILQWLTEAYHTAGGTLAEMEPLVDPSSGSDPMVPDDVDDPFA